MCRLQKTATVTGKEAKVHIIQLQKKQDFQKKEAGERKNQWTIA